MAVQLYLRDHGDAGDVYKASAKVTLLTGAEKQEFELKPAGGKLETTSRFPRPPVTRASETHRLGCGSQGPKARPQQTDADVVETAA
jgi:hypothetical protein